jgi:hypothetical protein
MSSPIDAGSGIQEPATMQIDLQPIPDNRSCRSGHRRVARFRRYNGIAALRPLEHERVGSVTKTSISDETSVQYLQRSATEPVVILEVGNE